MQEWYDLCETESHRKQTKIKIIKNNLKCKETKHISATKSKNTTELVR
jgi:hypothetical protein